eukprot:3353427-Pyramimonas_sp.AAC.1
MDLGGGARAFLVEMDMLVMAQLRGSVRQAVVVHEGPDDLLGRAALAADFELGEARRAPDGRRH